MKKVILNAAVVLLIIAVISGCNNSADNSSGTSGTDSSKSGASSKPASSFVASSQAVSSLPVSSSPASSNTNSEHEHYMNLLKHENQPELFLKAMKDKNLKDIKNMIYQGDIELLNTVDIESYSYEFIKQDDELYQNIYRVTLNVTKSGCRDFSVGESTYIARVSRYDPDDMYVFSVIMGFYPESKQIKINYQNEVFKDTSLITCLYYSCNHSDGLITHEGVTIIDNEKFIDMCLAVMPPEYEQPDGITKEEITEFALNVFGVTGLDFSDYYSRDGFYRYPSSVIRIPVFQVIKREYENDKAIQTITVDLYADNVNMIVAKTMKYTFSRNENGTYRLIKGELLFDSGAQVCTRRW